LSLKKIRNIAKISMFIAVLGLLFHDFVSHHHHSENNEDITCHHHPESDTTDSKSFDINQANSQHQHLNHSAYSHFYKHIVFNFTYVENHAIDLVKLIEYKETKISEFIQTKTYQQKFYHSLSHRGPPLSLIHFCFLTIF